MSTKDFQKILFPSYSWFATLLCSYCFDRDIGHCSSHYFVCVNDFLLVQGLKHMNGNKASVQDCLQIANIFSNNYLTLERD